MVKYHNWSMGADPPTSSNGRANLTGIPLLEYALNKVGSKHAGGQDWQCPAHDDEHASLGIKTGTNGRTVISCQAGCEPPKIMAALGLKMSDLFPAKSAIVATYPYMDENGELLFEVVRNEPKKFRQRAADGSWSVKGIRKVLYRLPEVLAAAAAGAVVWVVEGEKDVAAVEALGEVATTNPGGGGPGKWSDEYSAALIGAKVVIVVDRDATGYAHGVEVATSLRESGVKCRIVAPVPTEPHSDLSDHLAAGYGLEDLVPLSDDDLDALLSDGDESEEWPPLLDEDDVKAQAIRLMVVEAARELIEEVRSAEDPFPEVSRNLTEDWARPREPTQFRVQDLWSMDSNLLIAAQYKTGKTTLAQNLQSGLVDGGLFLGEFKIRATEGSVGYINYELPGEQWNEWSRDIGMVNTDRAWAMHCRGYNLVLDSERFIRLVAEHETSILILDNFGAAFRGEENSNSEVREWLHSIERMAMHSQVSQIVVIAHTGRAKEDEGNEHARGATRLDDWADVRWIYSDVDGKRFLTASGRDIPNIEFDVEYDQMTRRLTFGSGHGRAEARKNELINMAVAAVLTSGPEGISPSRVADICGKSRTTIKWELLLQQAMREGSPIESKVWTRGTHWRDIKYKGQPWEA